MPLIQIPLPAFGVSDGMPAIDQPGLVTDPDGMRNIVPEDGPSGRRRLATRPGTVAEYAGAFNTGRVQAIGEIARASGVVGTEVASTKRTTEGSGRDAGTLRGQAIVLERDFSTRAVLDDQRGTGLTSPPTGAGGYGAFCCAWHGTSDDVGYFSTVAKNLTLTTQDVIVAGLNRFDLATGAMVQQWVVDADAGYTSPLPADPPGPQQANILPNQIAQIGGYLFVAAYRHIYAYDATTLAYLGRKQIPFAEEVQGLAVFTRFGTDWLAVLFTGNYSASGPVVADAGPNPRERFGEFYRSGISLWAIQYTDFATKTPVAVGAAFMLQRLMPQGTQTGDGGYEYHGTYRFAEYSIQRPRGCLPFAFGIQVIGDGTIYAYVCRTNQGWGYDGTQANQKPDGLTANVNVCKINLTRAFESDVPAYMDPDNPVRYGPDESVGGWETDTGSLLRPYPWGASTFQTDIPKLAGAIDPLLGDSRDPELTDNEPTLWTVSLDVEREILVVSGRRPSLTLAGPTVFGLDSLTGGRVWELDLKAGTRQNAIGLDTANGVGVVSTYRTDGWEQQDGTPATDKAEVFAFGIATGQVSLTFDLTDAVNYNGFINSGSAIGTFGVAINRRGQTLIGLAPYRLDV